MATIEQQKALALAQARRKRAEQQAQQSPLQTYLADPLASLGAGIRERELGIRQAFATPERQAELGREVERARQFQSERGLTGQIGGIIGRDVLAPVAATVPFANPLGLGALATAGGIGAAQGYTSPAIGAQTAGERSLNAATSGVFGLAGQGIGGVLSRLLERGGSALLGGAGRAVGITDNVPSPALAAERVGETLRGQYGAAREAARGAYKAVEEAGETVSPQDIQNIILPQIQKAYSEARPEISSLAKLLELEIPSFAPKTMSELAEVAKNPKPETVLGVIQAAAKSKTSVPVSTLEAARKAAVAGSQNINRAEAFPFEVLKRAYDVAEQALPFPSVLQQAARSARSAQGKLFETPQEVARIVGAGVPEAQFTPPTGEQILQTIIGAGAKGKAGAANAVDDVFAAAGDAAPAVRADLRQAVIARAYTTAGEDAGKLAKELNKIVTQNESLAKKIFTTNEIKLIGRGAEGSAIDKFAQTFANPALRTGGGLLGLAGSGAAAVGLLPGAAMPAAILGGTTFLGTAAARQSARDAAALNMGGLLRELGVRQQAPGILSRIISPATSGVTTIPAQSAFTMPQANARKPLVIKLGPPKGY